MNASIRPAEPDDAPAVRAVAEDAWWAAYAGLLDAATIREALADLYEESFLRRVVAERDDILFLVAERVGGSEADTGTEDGEEAGADAEKGVVGFATAQQTWADEVEIHTLYVHPDHWEEGIGTALLESVEEAARDAGADRLRCEVASGNHVGRAFVEARGFERVETVTTEVGDETVPEDAFEKGL